MTLEATYQVSSRIAGIALLISSLEELSLRKAYASDGLYDLRYIESALRRPGASALHTKILGSPALMLLCVVLRSCAALSLLAGPDTLPQMATAWTVVSITTFAIQGSHRLGGEDGSDQMMAIMAIAFSCALTLGRLPGVLTAGVYFMGAQCVLAYATAGIAKLMCLEWRNGSAVLGVLSTKGHGSRWAARALGESVVLQYIACWATIVFEGLFVLAPLLPRPYLIVLLFAGVLFHAGIAMLMGLNGFFWAFVATYPCAIFLNEAIRGSLSLKVSESVNVLSSSV